MKKEEKKNKKINEIMKINNGKWNVRTMLTLGKNHTVWGRPEVIQNGAQNVIGYRYNNNDMIMVW